MKIEKSLILQKLFEPSDIAILVYFRIVFGAIMLWEIFRYFENDWIYDYWIEPSFHFTYYGFEWVRPWPGDGMYLHFIAMGILAVCIMIGFKYRVSAALFFVAFTYMFLLEHARYLNHFYLISLVSLVMIFIPAHKAFSYDSWRNKKMRADFVPAWPLWVLRIQIGVPYFFGGVAKLNEDWFAGSPLNLWLAERADSFPIFGQFFTQDWFVMVLAYSSLFIDLLAVPFLLWRRSRLVAFGVLVLFHVLNDRLFSIGIFPWFMIFATLVFFDPHWPRTFYKKFTSSQKPHPTTSQIMTNNQKLVLSLFLIFIIFQVAMPLRHFAYPGDVSWTEEGHNFSWHMKLRDKDTSRMVFLATDPHTGSTWELDPEDDLTSRQISKMSTRPDMIHQYSHFLAEKLRDEGYNEIQIRVELVSSLNGREPQMLIDPSVNLAAEPITILPKSWIVPLEKIT